MILCCYLAIIKLLLVRDLGGGEGGGYLVLVSLISVHDFIELFGFN